MAARPHPAQPPDDPSSACVRHNQAGEARSRRVVGVDVARGLALIGIIAVNVMPSTTEGGELVPAWILLAGRAAALFALIAGISVALISGGRRPPAGRAAAGPH